MSNQPQIETPISHFLANCQKPKFSNDIILQSLYALKGV